MISGAAYLFSLLFYLLASLDFPTASLDFFQSMQVTI
jgi:hypothetical protein